MRFGRLRSAAVHAVRRQSSGPASSSNFSATGRRSTITRLCVTRIGGTIAADRGHERDFCYVQVLRQLLEEPGPCDAVGLRPRGKRHHRRGGGALTRRRIQRALRLESGRPTEERERPRYSLRSILAAAALLAATSPAAHALDGTIVVVGQKTVVVWSWSSPSPALVAHIGKMKMSGAEPTTPSTARAGRFSLHSSLCRR